MQEDFRGLLDRKLLSVGGGAVTAGSLLVGAAIVLITLVVANLFALSTRRVLRARGTASSRA